MADEKPEVVFEGKFIRLIRKGGWEYIERSNCRGIVIIVAVTDEKEVLFVEQFRPPVEKYVIEFPAGLVSDKGARQESILEGARRELYEETGYLSDNIVKIMEGPVSGGASADIVTMVRAFNIYKAGPGGGDDDEAIIVHKIPLEKTDEWLKQMHGKGYLIEPKIFTGLYFLKNNVLL